MAQAEIGFERDIRPLFRDEDKRDVVCPQPRVVQRRARER